MADSPLMTRKQSTLKLRLTGAAFFFLFFAVGVGVGIGLLVHYVKTPEGARHPAQLVMAILPMIFILVGAGGMYASLKKEWITGAAITHAPGFTPAISRQETTLTPVVSRRLAASGLALFSIVWNGALFFMVSRIMRSGGAISIGALVFMTPFVLAGLVVAGITVHHLLGLVNPRAKVIVSSPAVALGDQVTISWSIEGAIERLSGFTIELQGSEEATYRRGTSTKTDRRVFASIPVTSSGPGVQRTGFTTVTIPANTMHSFTAPNNKIVWVVRVRGAIPRWPDSDDQYRFTVSPKAT